MYGFNVMVLYVNEFMQELLYARVIDNNVRMCFFLCFVEPEMCSSWEL